MAGRAQRIIWFLLLSPCCLPTLHFLISLKIVRSPLCFPCCYHHYRSFFVNYSTFQNSTTHTHTRTKKNNKNPPHLHKIFASKTDTHTFLCISAFRSGGCCKSVATTRNCLWQTVQPELRRPLPCQPCGTLAHLSTAPRWWTIRSPLPSLWGRGPMWADQWSLERKEKTNTHTHAKKFNNHAQQCMFIRAILMNNKQHY